MSLRENFISDDPDEETGGKVNANSQNKTLSGKIKGGDKVTLTIKDGNLEFDVT